MRVAMVAVMALVGVGAVQAQSWSGVSNALALGLPAAAAWSAYDGRDGDGAVQLGQSLGTTLGSVLLLKSQISARRPDGSDDDSFPSGHTAIAFASARFMHKRYPDAVSPALLYGAAGLTALARVQADKHYWKDTVAGAALGYVLADYWTEAKTGPKLAVLPTARGVVLAWQQPLR